MMEVLGAIHDVEVAVCVAPADAEGVEERQREQMDVVRGRSEQAVRQQHVLYRLNRITELTGRRTTDAASSAELHIALRAARLSSVPR
ncbi:helix-turn-helix domain-containing protein [Streptomyces sp. 2A115]|uniref:helix-turn-helix domain-containing protein n=1 Tax=Streptomyces sp. 2A115 TaxID=3457439 RepID=UPI003FD4C791